MAQTAPSAARRVSGSRPTDSGEPLTLAIDIGGTHLKAGVLTPEGQMVAGPARVETPSPSTPDAVFAALAELVVQLGPFRRMSIGFPGVVRRGRVLTAPNLGTAPWHDFALAEALGDRLSVPARLANDATVQGLGVIARRWRGVRHYTRYRNGVRAVRGRSASPAPRAEPASGARRQDL